MADNKGAITEVTDDFDLNDIEDLPAFVTPPNGVYSVDLPEGIDTLEINDANYYKAEMVISNVDEVTGKLDEGETLPKIGDKITVIFKRDNEYGMGNFKLFMRPFVEKFGTTKIGELREASKGCSLMIVTKRKWNKEKEVYNLQIVKAAIL